MKRVKWGKKKAKKRAEISEEKREKGKANSSKDGSERGLQKREREGKRGEGRRPKTKEKGLGLPR